MLAIFVWAEVVGSIITQGRFDNSDTSEIIKKMFRLYKENVYKRLEYR